jgi:hypothetical protein
MRKSENVLLANERYAMMTTRPGAFGEVAMPSYILHPL